MLLRRVPAACSWICLLLPVSLSLRPLQPPEICARTEVPEFYAQIYRDLEPYKVLDEQHMAFYDGFCARRQKACIRLRIVNGAAYVLDMFPGYQSRHRSTLHAIYRVISRFGNLPDVEVTIDLTDGELQNIDLPFLVITHKKEAPVGILYPDFTFYSWPESMCPSSESEISHNYDQLFREFRQHWGVRARKAVSSTGQNEVQGCVGLLEQCKHRYLAFLAGTTYSSRIKYQLLCGSLVLAQEPRFLEWWSRLLAPGVHYVPVETNWANVQPLMQLLRQNPLQAARIARQGQRLAMTALSPTSVDCYWWMLLASSARVLPPASGPLSLNARPLEDVLLLPDDATLSSLPEPKSHAGL